MIIFITGKDQKKRIEKKDVVISDLKEKKPDAQFFSYDKFNLDIEILKSEIFQTGLFEKKSIFSLSGILEEKVFSDFVFKNLEQLEKSENAFILDEEKIDKRNLDKIKKITKRIFEFEEKNFKKDFNVFSLTDLMLSKNKKKLWLEFHKAKIQNIEDENIYGVFLWQLKNILLVLNEDSSTLKPFIISKIKNNLKNWQKKEVEEKYFELLNDYHKVRLGEKDLNIVLEKFILNL